METTIIIYLKRVLYWVVFALLGVAFLLNISATTITFIKQRDHKMAIQKRDVMIYGLMISCEMDKFLFTTNPKYKETRGKSIENKTSD